MIASTQIHARLRSVLLIASLTGRIGLSPVSVHTESANSAARSTRNLTRSHHGSGLRVVRSSSRDGW